MPDLDLIKQAKQGARAPSRRRSGSAKTLSGNLIARLWSPANGIGTSSDAGASRPIREGSRATDAWFAALAIK